MKSFLFTCALLLPSHKVGTAELTIGLDGVVTLTRKTPGSGSTCLEKLGTHRLW